LSDNAITRAGSENMIVKFFSKPAVGIIGSLASIIGLLLAIYFYTSAKSHRELSYYVHPAKAIIAKTDEFSRLSVLVDGKPTKQNITAVQFAFWNEGKEPIRPENVLKPLTVKLSGSTPIVDALIRKKSRDVINIDLDKEKIDKGILRINWNLLEENDGGIIQIIFLGNIQTSIVAKGIIEGQGDINKVEYKGKLRSSAEQYEYLCQQNKRAAYTIGSLVLFLYMLTALLLFLKKKKGQLKKMDFIFFIGPLVLFTFVTVWIFLRSIPPGPPFGF